MLLNLVSEGSLSYDGLSRITAANAAKVFHLRQKGAVAEGFDADLTLVRPCVPWKAELARMRTKSRESAALFERFEFTHRIEDTISRGRIAHSIRGVPMPCGGKFIKPTLRAT
jgi:allantoinase